MAAHADTENFDWKDATEDEAAADKTSDLTAAMHFAQVENDARRSRKRVVVGGGGGVHGQLVHHQLVLGRGVEHLNGKIAERIPPWQRKLARQQIHVDALVLDPA